MAPETPEKAPVIAISHHFFDDFRRVFLLARPSGRKLARMRPLRDLNPEYLPPQRDAIRAKRRHVYADGARCTERIEFADEFGPAADAGDDDPDDTSETNASNVEKPTARSGEMQKNDDRTQCGVRKAEQRRPELRRTKPPAIVVGVMKSYALMEEFCETNPRSSGR